MKDYRNAIIIHGGGLVDPSKEVIMRIARGLYQKKVYNQIYIGRYSFMSLYNKSLWLHYDENMEASLKDKRGTYFGTCRGIDMSHSDIMNDALSVLKENDVETVIVCGGDGSSRNCAEVSEQFRENGINLIFAVPLTVDGINGGHSIGIDQAVREAVRQIENVAATSLETRDNGQFSIVAVETQGRNRDDILATVLQHLHRQGKVADCGLDEMLLIVVPANYATYDDVLIRKINASVKRTLVLVSEGATFKVSELQSKTHRKVRTVVIGHAAQSNGMTTEEDMQRYDDWMTDVINLIADNPINSYCIVNDGISRWREPIDYYARLNPREGQQAELSYGLEELLKRYMA